MEVLKSFILIISNPENLCLIGRFGDLFCVEDELFWGKLE